MARASRHLAWIVLVGAALRVGACVAITPTGLLNDEVLYHGVPAEIASGKPFGDAAGRAPGVIALYSVLYRFMGASVDVARAANVALSVATIPMIFLLARRLAGERAGVVAAALTACYPVLIAFSHYLFTETLYIFLLIAGLVTLVGGGTAPGPLRVAASGALFGLCALTREVGLAAPLVAAGYLAWVAAPRPWAGLRLAALLIAVSGLTIAPWTVALNRHSDGFVLLSQTTWMNLYLGNHPGAHFHTYERLGETRPERERVARRIALDAIAARMPAWPLEKTLRNLPRLLRPTAFPVKRLLQRPEGDQDPFGTLGSWAYRFRWRTLDRPDLRGFAALTIAVGYVGVALAGVAGLALARERSLAALLGAFALAHVAPVLLTFASTRFRLPIMPLLIVGASVLAVGPSRCWSEASRGQRAAAAVVLTVLLACWVVERSAWLSPTVF